MSDNPSKKKILVVEDNEKNLKLVYDLLQMKGFAVKGIRDGLEALDELKTWKPDLILLDINLPKMDGYEFFQKMKETDDYKSIKVVAVTALVTKKEKEDIMNKGFDGYIPKPLRTKTFVQEVEAFL